MYILFKDILQDRDEQQKLHLRMLQMLILTSQANQRIKSGTTAFSAYHKVLIGNLAPSTSKAECNFSIWCNYYGNRENLFKS